MPMGPDTVLTASLTVAEWNALSPKIFDPMFQATMKLNVQLIQQQAQMEGQGPRAVPEEEEEDKGAA